MGATQRLTLVNGLMSKRKAVISGVSQGSILQQILFNIFTNDTARGFSAHSTSLWITMNCVRQLIL